MYFRHEKAASKPVDVPKSTQGKHAPAVHSGRKSRKSQPKRNYRPTAVIDSDEDSGVPTAQDMSWREPSASSIEDMETSGRDMGDSEMSFDLSKVKHEVEEGEEHMKAKQNDKG